MGDPLYIKYFTNIWLLILLTISCSPNKSEQNFVESVNCEGEKYFSYTDKVKYREYSIKDYSNFVSPLKYDFFPRIAVYNDNKKAIKNNTFSLEESISVDFINKTELSEFLSIEVDTNSYYTYLLRDSSLQEKHCFIARSIFFKNNSIDKYFLEDRFRLKLLLQAKNDAGKWMELHDTRAIGCGLENQIHPKDQVNILPPISYIQSCFLLEDGDFETSCRIKYLYYNSIDSSFFRTSKNRGYFQKFFKIDTLENAIYSNTFRQKISKQRLRNSKRIF